MTQSLQILLVRPDRLGDVILSTPVLEVMRRHYPQSQITLLVQENLVPILKNLSTVNSLMIFDPLKRHAGILGFFRLYTDLRKQRFDIAVILQNHWKIALAVLFAQIPYRIGPLSPVYSFFCYNQGVRQRRSHVEMHETDYNLQLLSPLGIRVGTRQIATQICVPLATQQSSRQWLEKQGWNSKKQLILIHPGMGGSALNWPEIYYYELIRILVQNDQQILITGGVDESALLDRIAHALGELQTKVIFYKSSLQPQSEQLIDFFAGLCQQAHLVIAPSTGPLHVAVALKKRVLTFYSPIRVQSAIRWGPYCMDESTASIFVPEMYCGQDFKCLGHLCNYFLCMKSITVKQVLEQVYLHLKENKT